MDISKIDTNFNNYFNFEGMKTYDVNEPPFCLYGLCRSDEEADFKRLPHEVSKSVDNPSVNELYTNTSGIRVKFRTDSKRIILKCILPQVCNIAHMPVTGSSCFDLYADGRYCNAFRPGIDINGHYSDNIMEKDGYCSGYTFHDRKMREILIHFPLYNDVSQVYIALEEDANLSEPGEYKFSKPVVFYGSSITQGGCASHPGNCYPAMLSRRLDCDFLNLGFSGGCRAESELAEYIADLEKSVLVFDYDHNAPSVEYLKETHERFFDIIRAKNPELPVIMVSAADLCLGIEERTLRREVIYKTYANAVAKGDKNVYFVDGFEIYKEVGLDYCTVDDTHPNDLGFWCMANSMENILRSILI